jgi:hypothetical protein
VLRLNAVFTKRKWAIMKTVLISAILILSTLTLRAEPSTTLPSAPTPVQAKAPHTFGLIDYSLASGVVIVNAMDWSTTEECERRPYQQCHEAVLNTSLVKSKVGFGFYKAATAGLEVYGAYYLARHGHRRLARLSQVAVIAFTLRTDLHNNHFATTPVIVRQVVIAGGVGAR